MEVLYESDKKENRIKLLEKEKRIAGLYMAGIAGLFLISLLTAIIIIRQINYRKVITEQEMLIKEQKIIEMEKDKQIIAANAVMEGEETERKRLARDLHDGLGGLLSGLKYSLLNVKGNFVTTDKSAAELDYSIVLLDNSIQELRRVAQNMMPQSLLKLGLKDALSDFCETAGKTKNMIINYHYFGQEERMPSKFETAIYRIVQELVNNSLKHSEADDILVQVVHDTNRVHVFVRDNGKGFNFDGNNTIKGIGLASIKSRVDALNARLDINTSPGHGTEVNLEMFF